MGTIAKAWETTFRKDEILQVYSITEVAALTGKSVQSIRSWCRKNEIERDGRRYLITPEILTRIGAYYNADLSKVSETIESVGKDSETLGKEEKPSRESTDPTGDDLILSQMEAVLEAKQEQIDFLKEELAKVREDKEKEIERLREDVDKLNAWHTRDQSTINALAGIAAEQKMRLLMQPSIEIEQQVNNQEEKVEKKKSWLDRLLGR